MRVRAFRVLPHQPDEVWRTVADHEGMSDWSPAVTVTLERSGKIDTNGVGAVRLVKGPGVSIREEVTEFEPGHLLAYKVLSGLPLRDYRGEIFLSGTSAGTAVTWTLSCENRSVVVRYALRATANVFLNALALAVKRRVLAPN